LFPRTVVFDDSDIVSEVYLFGCLFLVITQGYNISGEQSETRSVLSQCFKQLACMSHLSSVMFVCVSVYNCVYRNKVYSCLKSVM